MTTDTDRDARIRERAHRIWESEGRPDDRAEVHWSIAERIVDEEDNGRQPRSEPDIVDEASAESFPASDPPAIAEPITSVRSRRPANRPSEALVSDQRPVRRRARAS